MIAGAITNRGFSRQPSCMARTMKIFCIRKNIFSHREESLFLPCKTAAAQNPYKPMQRHVYRPVYFRYFSRETGQFQSISAHFGKEKTMRPHVNMSTLRGHDNISPCCWLQLVSEVPVGIWIRDKFKLKINRSVKTPWQEYGVVAGS